jgi:hypothetical protein
MLESVERFNRAFGTEQAPYFVVGRVQSRLLTVAMAARTAFRAARHNP